MLKFLIAIVIFAFVWLVIQLIRVKIIVKRFCVDVSVVQILKNWLLDSDELYNKFESKPFTLILGKYYVKFDNFTGAVNYLEEYTKEVMNDYQKIIGLTDYYDLSEHEQILNDINYKIKMWRWKHGSIEN